MVSNVTIVFAFIFSILWESNGPYPTNSGLAIRRSCVCREHNPIECSLLLGIGWDCGSWYFSEDPCSAYTEMPSSCSTLWSPLAIPALTCPKFPCVRVSSSQAYPWRFLASIGEFPCNFLQRCRSNSPLRRGILVHSRTSSIHCICWLLSEPRVCCVVMMAWASHHVESPLRWGFPCIRSSSWFSHRLQLYLYRCPW